MEPLEAFRRETRAWLSDNWPETMRNPTPPDEVVWGGRLQRFAHPDAELWLERMASKGWTAPTWPKEYGGGGLSKEEDEVLREELRRLDAREPLFSFGLYMLGPALLEFGSEEQKRSHLPKIARGEVRWCQGYSEPGAGSDLAGLQMAAVEDGDHYVVNGQKVWTSHADLSDWIFCLVRTDSSRKHGGISFLLIDMQSPGVSTRPIRLISGSSPFCETFFDEVRVPKANLVGEMNGGWAIAKALLQHERAMVSGLGLGGPMAGGAAIGLLEAAKRHLGERGGRIDDAALRRKLAMHQIKGRAFALTSRRVADEAKAGGGPGAAASILKYYGTEHNKARFELLLEMLGTQGLGWEGDGFATDELAATRAWLRSKGNSIEGGTSEIQLDVISKRVLGLPGAK
jgi:alkylation response protein AidB-like acyl-CoA dehydrogenase